MKHRKKDIVYMNDIKKSISNKKASKRKIAILIIILLIIILLITFFLVYSLNQNFRKYADNSILPKEVEENNLPYINIENMANAKFFAWGDNIAIINENKITKYDSLARETAKINVEITSPIVESNGEYAVVAENNGKKIYVLKKNAIIWEKEMEGQISRINVNKNGYVVVILTGTTYKSVLSLYDEEGTELFKTYLSSNLAVNAEISNDNKFLAFAEINVSGTVIQSNIKIISIEKAKDKDQYSDAIVYTYNAETNDLIVDLRYQNKNRLICQYDNSIHIIENNTDQKVMDINNNDNNSFADVKLNNYISIAQEENKDLFSNAIKIKFINVDSLKENIYSCDGSIKTFNCWGDKAVINTGKQIYFIGTNAWLIKKYKSGGEVKNIIMNNSIAGVVYKNKIEIIKL